MRRVVAMAIFALACTAGLTQTEPPPAIWIADVRYQEYIAYLNHASWEDFRGGPWRFDSRDKSEISLPLADGALTGYLGSDSAELDVTDRYGLLDMFFASGQVNVGHRLEVTIHQWVRSDKAGVPWLFRIHGSSTATASQMGIIGGIQVSTFGKFFWNSVLMHGTTASTYQELPQIVDRNADGWQRYTLQFGPETLYHEGQTYCIASRWYYWGDVGYECWAASYNTGLASGVAQYAGKVVYKLDNGLVSVEVRGPSEVWEQNRGKDSYQCIAHYADGSEKDVTDKATWSVKQPVGYPDEVKHPYSITGGKLKTGLAGKAWKDLVCWPKAVYRESGISKADSQRVTVKAHKFAINVGGRRFVKDYADTGGKWWRCYDAEVTFLIDGAIAMGINNTPCYIRDPIEGRPIPMRGVDSPYQPCSADETSKPHEGGVPARHSDPHTNRHLRAWSGDT